MPTIVYESPTGIREKDLDAVDYDEKTDCWQIRHDGSVRAIPRERVYYLDRDNVA